MSLRTRLFALCALALGFSTGLLAQDAPPTPFRLMFQTDRPWSPRTNIPADTVLAYGLDPTLADRVAGWHAHGYRVVVMTGVAWGRYATYLRGSFDGQPHWDETQQRADGSLILHSGREVPYLSPSLAFGRFLAQGVVAALDAGAEGVVLEEPEFWAAAGWSPAFKREWADFYHAPWQAPDSSPDAQYRASQLKYFLYRRALGQVFQAVRAYATAHHRSIPCYVATHSLINYAQWQIVSPESSLLQVGADGYIAQVWTGTSRAENTYRGVTAERTFETALLEYGALQNIARASGKPIWYLNDPIEDDPEHSWADYRGNWQSTLVASLLQPDVARYEVLPWPDRIFGPKGLYPTSEPTSAQPHPDKAAIPAGYATELQTVFNALGELAAHPGAPAEWQTPPPPGLGILLSDTLMFQRAAPTPSDANLGNFYGLAMPLVMDGLLPEPVQMETTTPATLAHYKLLMLTYEGQKPPSPAIHKQLAAWVRAGGVLLVVDDDKDPYNAATGWWNTGELHDRTPRLDLFRQLGLEPAHAAGLHPVGQGYVLYAAQSPTALAAQPGGAAEVLRLVHAAAAPVRLALSPSPGFVLRRGPYVVAAGLDDAAPAAQAQTQVHGELVDLFDPGLAVREGVAVGPGARAFLLDLAKLGCAGPCVAAASGKVTAVEASAKNLSFAVDGIDGTDGVVRVFTDGARLQAATLAGKVIEPVDRAAGTLLFKWGNTSAPQRFALSFAAAGEHEHRP